jgi:membrane-associated protease RseP (regulator of RpoE activity)
MNENRFTVWHISGIAVIALSVAALLLGGGVFLGYQWGQADSLAAAVSSRVAGPDLGETLCSGAPFGMAPFQESPRGPFLGVEYDAVTPELAQSEKLGVPAGAVIRAVITGSPADKAGLQVGDVIQKVNGSAVTTAISLRELVRSHQAGDTLTLTVWRDGKSSDFDVILAALPCVTNLPVPGNQP